VYTKGDIEGSKSVNRKSHVPLFSFATGSSSKPNAELIPTTAKGFGTTTNNKVECLPHFHSNRQLRWIAKPISTPDQHGTRSAMCYQGPLDGSRNDLPLGQSSPWNL